MYVFFRSPTVNSNKRMDYGDKDCGTKVCDLHYRLVDVCVLYLDKTSELKCDFPCDTTNCITETHAMINCPVWSCTDKSTTLPPPTTSPSGSGSDCSGSLCIASVSLNVIIFLVILVALLLFVSKKIRNRSNTESSEQRVPSFENPLSGFDYFVYQGPSQAENVPLLPVVQSQREATPPGPSRPHLPAPCSTRSASVPLMPVDPNSYYSL